MFNKMILSVFIITVLNGCATKVVVPTADGYVDAITNQDIATLKAYERDGQREIAMAHQGSAAENVKHTQYPLHAAVKLSKMKVTKFMLNNNHDINTFNADKNTPLMLAVAQEDLSLVKLLLEHDADPDIEVPFIGVAAIDRAIQLESTDILTALIDHGAAVDKPNRSGTTPLIFAMRMERLDVMKILIDAGADVNHRLNSGWTMLLQAVDCNPDRGNGTGEIVKFLIEAGADVNLALESGTTPVALAVTHNHLPELKLLLAAGADPNIKNNNNGWTPIHWAVNDKKEQPHDASEMVQLLIDAGARLDAQTNSGTTPVKLAVTNNRLNELHILLNANADIDTANSDGWTPLLDAADENKIEMVKLLIKAGADVNYVRKSGWGAIHRLVNSQEHQHFDGSEIIALLINAGVNIEQRTRGGDTPLSLAASNDRINELRLLLANNAEVNSVDNKGRTPLYNTIFGDNIAIVKALIKAGADVNIANNVGWTPLYSAIGKNKMAVVKLLITAGGDVNIANNRGWTPLHRTVNSLDNQKFDGKELMRVLIDAGAKINMQTKAGDTAVNLAATNDRLNELDLLLTYNPDINKADNAGITPIASAIMKNHVYIVKVLIGAGVDVNLADNNGWSPLHKTVNKPKTQQFEGTELASLLIGAGANLEPKIKNGFSPLMLASYYGRFNEAKLLIDSGADISSRNEQANGETALDYALHKGNAKIAALIRATK